MQDDPASHQLRQVSGTDARSMNHFPVERHGLKKERMVTTRVARFGELTKGEKAERARGMKEMKKKKRIAGRHKVA